MKRVSLVSRIFFMCASVVVVVTLAVSCSGLRAKVGENSTYSIIVDSESVGVQFGPAQYQIGLAYLSQNNYQEALTAFTSALNNGYSTGDVHFGRAHAYNDRGLAYYCKGNYDQAISDCSTAIKLDPSDSMFYHVRG